MTVSSIAIRPPKPRVDNIAEFKELWKFRHLLFVLVERGIRGRYKNSALGVAWSMITPLMSVFVLTIVVGFIMHAGSRNLSAYIFCTMAVWSFFQTSVLDSSVAVLQQLGILKKVYIPRELPILSAVFQNFVQFVISLAIFILYRWVLTTLIFHRWVGMPPVQILYLPVVIVIMLLCTTGISLFIGAANVFYEDIKFVMTLLLSLGFYLVPIIYPAEQIRYAPRLGHWAPLLYHIYLLNPVAWMVEAFRQMFFGVYNMAPVGSNLVQMTAPFDPRFMAIDGLESLVFCYCGYAFFNKLKWKFTERP